MFTATATVQNLSYGQSSQRPIDNSAAYIYGLTDDGLHFTMSFYVPGSSTQIMYTFSRNTINDPFTRAASWGWGNTTYGRIYLNNGYYLYNGNIYDDESTLVGAFTGLNGNLYMLYNIPDTNFFVIQAGSAIHTYKVNQDGTIVEFPLSITSSVVRRWGEPLFSEQHTYFLTNKDYESPNATQTNIISITRGSVTYTALIDANAESHDVLTGKKYYKNNGLHIGTMPNNGQIDITPSTSSQNIPAGYTSGGTVSAVTSAIDNNIVGDNIKQGVEILGVTGTYAPTGGDATSDANIQAKYLLEGYSAVSDGQWIQGTMRNYGTTTITYTSEVQSIPTGYYDTLTIPIAQAQNLDGYDECELALQKVNDDKVGYTELNYIQGTGTQYIDTNITVNKNDNITLIEDCAISTDNYAGANGYMQWTGGITNNQLKTVKVEYKNITETISVDDTVISTTSWSSFDGTNVKLGIFKLGDSNNSWHSADSQSGKIYSCKIYNNDTLVRNFIPVKRNSDDVICLYDKVTRAYFLNQGTGNFISGGVKE